MQSQLLDFVLASNNERLIDAAYRYMVDNLKLVMSTIEPLNAINLQLFFFMSLLNCYESFRNR